MATKAKTSGKSKSKASKKSAARQRYDVQGFSLCAVLQHCGAKGFNAEQTRQALASVGHASVNSTTLSIQRARGRAMGKDAPALSAELSAKLAKAASSTKGSKAKAK